MEIENGIEYIKEPIYLAMAFTLYALYFSIYVGVFYVNPRYIETLSYAIRLFVCTILVFKFHPFREHKLKHYDSQIIFASAVLILTDMGITQYVVRTISSKANIKI